MVQYGAAQISGPGRHGRVERIVGRPGEPVTLERNIVRRTIRDPELEHVAWPGGDACRDETVPVAFSIHLKPDDVDHLSRCPSRKRRDAAGDEEQQQQPLCVAFERIVD
jgi:hypothetical protein